MGIGASVKHSSTVLSDNDLPKQLYVEGAGSAIANGKFVLRSDKDEFPFKSSSGNVARCNRTVWFAKENGEGCWIGYVDTSKTKGNGSNWIIFNARDILYTAPTSDEKFTPLQGRWELGEGGAVPAPTVNLQPLPTAFRMTGWKGPSSRLNGEYLPLDDGTKLMNGRPVFTHTPMVGLLGHQEMWQMYWSCGTWCIGEKEQLQLEQLQLEQLQLEQPGNQRELKRRECMFFVETDATHPTAIPAKVLWKSKTTGRDVNGDQNHFEVVEGIHIATGTSVSINIYKTAKDDIASLTVRPWFDMVEDIRSQVCSVDIPSQRQQLFLGSKRLQEDGRVLALHGVVAGSTLHLVTHKEIELLDILFASTAVAVEAVGAPVPEQLPGAYWRGVLSSVDGRIYLCPRSAKQAARFDLTTQTWEAFGDTFPETEFLGPGDKWGTGVLSNADGCIYSFPFSFSEVHRVLKIDPAKSTAREVGGDLRQLTDVQLLMDAGKAGKAYPWDACCATADGCIFGTPYHANSAVRYDPRTQEFVTFGQLEDTGTWKYFHGVLGPSGRYIFCAPMLASRVLCIDTQELTIELIGPDFGRVHSENFFSLCKWLDGALGLDNRIYYTPCNARQLLRIDPASMTASLFGPDLHRLTGGPTFCPWDQGPSGMDGCLYCSPHTVNRTLRINPFAGTVSLVGEAIPNDLMAKLGAPVLDKDGAIWCLPVNTVGGARMVRITPGQPHTALLTNLLKTKHHVVLRDGLRDLPCYGPALVVELFSEAVRNGGDCTLVSSLLETAATVLPTVVTTSIMEDNGSTASMIFRTILAVLPPQDFGTQQINEEEEVRRAYLGAYTAAPFAVAKNYATPFKAIRVLATDENVLSRCFATSDELRSTLLCIIYRSLVFDEPTSSEQNLSSKASGARKTRSPSPDKRLTSMQQDIVAYLKAERPNLAAVFQATRCAPPALSTNDRQWSAFLSHFVAALSILQAPAPNGWQPLPKSADEWSWPPAPLVPLRAAGKLIASLGSDTVQAMWTVLAGSIVEVLVCMVDAVEADAVHATDVLTSVFDRERKSSLDTYQKQLRRARRDPTFPEFKEVAANLMKQLTRLKRKELRVQTISSFPELLGIGHALHARFNEFLAKLAQKCAGAKALPAPLKGITRALEKLVLRPGAPAKVKSDGVGAVDATTLVDVVRGSLECPDFTEIVFTLDLLRMLDVDLGQPKKAREAGWDLNKFQLRIIYIKDRFTKPTSGGWADAMVNFSFAHGDETHHVMELQLQHSQMLVVRKEGKAHARYNSFRSAFELLEAVGREPRDVFKEVHEDLPPLQKLEQRVQKMEQMRRTPPGKPDQQMQKQMQQMEQQIQKLLKQHVQEIDQMRQPSPDKPDQQMEIQLQQFEKQMEQQTKQQMQVQVQQQVDQVKQQMEQMKQQMEEMEQQMKQYQFRTQQQIDDLRAKNESLQSRLGEQHDVNESTNEAHEATTRPASASASTTAAVPSLKNMWQKMLRLTIQQRNSTLHTPNNAAKSHKVYNMTTT